MPPLKINVVQYDPSWPSQFQSIESELSHALSDFLLDDSSSSSYTIEHVGSTSVPSLCAKPIIDIDIIVHPEHIMEAVMALTSHGFTYAYEAVGIDRMVFRYNRHSLDSGGSRPTEDGSPRRAVYLNKVGGVALANHLAVRDVLRRDEEMRREYGDVKVLAAKETFRDIGEYGRRKDEVIWKILGKSGLSEEMLRRIRERPRRRVDEEIRLAKMSEGGKVD